MFHLFHLVLNCVHVVSDVNVKPLELFRVQLVTIKHLYTYYMVVVVAYVGTAPLIVHEFSPNTCLVLLQCGQKVLEMTRRAFDLIRASTSGTPSDFPVLS